MVNCGAALAASVQLVHQRSWWLLCSEFGILVSWSLTVLFCSVVRSKAKQNKQNKKTTTKKNSKWKQGYEKVILKRCVLPAAAHWEDFECVWGHLLSVTVFWAGWLGLYCCFPHLPCFFSRLHQVVIEKPTSTEPDSSVKFQDPLNMKKPEMWL